MDKSIDQLLERLFADLNPKQRKVVTGRFGLKSGEGVTLQEIGDELGITRERVRQIEVQTMKKLGTSVRREAGGFLAAAEKFLKGAGGVRRADNFIQDLIHDFFQKDAAKYIGVKIHFLLIAAGTPRYAKEDDDYFSYWYADDAAREKFIGFVKRATQFFKKTDRRDVLEGRAHFAECKDFSSCHMLSVPKHIGVNVFGDVGLREWPEIEPKTVRDKSYLVLKKHEKPLHFTDVAKHIVKYGIDVKPAHVQTVHNELIKDGRFVLVGRGIYGLREHGYEPGTVREVIARLLKKNGPLAAPKVVQLVNRERFLKENTILLGLQNKRYFKRLGDGRFHVREA
ncbi:MAG: sigma factor-like helix-turn-helix DNA-binding protein [Candidatus Jorgensenbacteria bacterium]